MVTGDAEFIDINVCATQSVVSFAGAKIVTDFEEQTLGLIQCRKRLRMIAQKAVYPAEAQAQSAAQLDRQAAGEPLVFITLNDFVSFIILAQFFERLAQQRTDAGLILDSHRLARQSR